MHEFLLNSMNEHIVPSLRVVARLGCAVLNVKVRSILLQVHHRHKIDRTLIRKKIIWILLRVPQKNLATVHAIGSGWSWIRQ